MDLTPPSLTGSPASSPSTSSPLNYPSPELVDPHYKIASMYEQSCSAITSSMDPGNTLAHGGDVTTSAGWNGNAMLHASTSAGLPNILSADYDPFAHYEPSLPTPYSHDMYTHQHPHTAVLSNNSPSLAGTPSRSPDISARHPGSYPPLGSPIPRIKMEVPGDYHPAGLVSQYPSPRSIQTLPAESSSYGSTPNNSGYLSDIPTSAWPKSEYSPHDPDQFASGASGLGPTLLRDRSQGKHRNPRRKPRRPTTKEEANFQCEVRGCGKLFSRSYNFKAHMETHDEKREYPFPCQMPDCNKKFVRKTDLQRHNQSVHMKEKNHKCDFCGRMFARKDTLRRHMEDGCAKRFDIGTLDLRSQGYDAYPPDARPPGGHHLPPTSNHLPPLSMSHGGGGSLLSSVPSFNRR